MNKIWFCFAAVILVFALTGCTTESEDLGATEQSSSGTIEQSSLGTTEQSSLGTTEQSSGDDALNLTSAEDQVTGNTTENENMKRLKLKINGTEVSVDWEDNESVTALTELAAKAPITVQMSMYGGFEQVGSLGTSLPRDDAQTTTQAGDIVLYSGNQIVVFYGSNTWAYTRLGKIEEITAEDLRQMLGENDVTLTLELE